MRNLTAAFLLLAATASCSRDLELAAAPDLGDGTISGALTVELPGESEPVPAAGALVELLDPTGASVGSETAGAEGRFAIRPPAPPWTLLFRHDSDGDGSYDRQRLLSSRELPLIAGADYSVGELAIGQNAELRGHVRRGDRQNPDDGHDGTTVVLGGSSFPPTTSAPDGSFRLRDLPSGTVRVLFSRDGYTAESRTVVLDPGEAKELVDLELSSLVDSVGTLSGTAAREDGAPATVVIEASREGDLTPAGRLPVPAGAPFTLAPLPAGTYRVTATIPGYGTAVVAGLEVIAGEVADLGTLTVLPDDPVIPPPDGAAVAGWDPSPALVLPAMGTIVATLDRDVALPLEFDGELLSGPQLLELTDEDGRLAPNGQELVPSGTLLPDGTTSTTAVVRFTPRRPLRPGRWTATLRSSVLDAAGRPAQPSATTWTVIGTAISPAHNDPDAMPLRDAPPERPSILAHGGRSATLLTADFDGGNGYESRLCDVGGDGSTFCNGTGGSTFDISRTLGPRFISTPDSALQLHFKQSRCFPGEGEAVLNDAWGFMGAAGFGTSTECAVAAAQAGGAQPLVALATSAGQLAVYQPTLLPPGTSWTFPRRGAVPFLSTVRDLQLFDAGPERFLRTVTANEAGDFEPRLHLHRVIGGLPGTELESPLPAGEGQSSTACSFQGQPLLLSPSYTGVDAGLPELQAFVYDGEVWTQLPSLVGLDPAGVTCAEVGLVTFVAFSAQGRIRLYYFDGASWAPVLDGTTPDGSLTVGPCQGASPALAVEKDSVLVSWYDSCFDSATGASSWFLRAKRAR